MPRFCLVVLTCLLYSTMYAQSPDSMMRVYADEIPHEKIHVQFDKGVYRAGETIWFKAYVFAGYQPSLTSKNFFAELIDPGGNVLQRKTYPVFQSAAAGDFDIPENFGAGHLTFRAYTTMMLNFDTAFLYQKNLDIIGKAGALPAKTPAQAQTTYNLHFFPEGGDLVNELESAMAFKANDNFGNPVSVSGTIINAAGETVESFKSVHDGMGVVTFTPKAGQVYKATWKDPNGIQQTTPLPEAKPQGVVLTMSTAGNKKIFIVKRSEAAPQNYQTLNVEAHLGQELVYKARVPLINTMVNSGSIPVGELPAGVLLVTVFTENWQPIAERIIMVNNNNYRFNVDVKALEVNTAIRAKNAFEIQTADTTLSNLSIAITDAEINNKLADDNIISRLLLTGDIKGYVNNPAYYFSNLSDSVSNHLNLVLLTHGWRKYNWADMVSNRRPKLKFPTDPPLALTAKVFGITSLNPLSRDEQIIAIVRNQDSTTQVLQLPKTGADVFSLPGQLYFDTINVIYQFNKDKRLDRNAAVKFDNGLYKGPAMVHANALPFYFVSDKDSILMNRSKFLAQQISKFGSSWTASGNVLQGVTVKARVKTRLEELDAKYASGLFKGDAITFDMSENMSMDIFTYLQGRVPGLVINNSGGNVSLQWRGSGTSVFLDEMQAQPDQLLSLSPADIAYVKVFRPPFFGAMGGGAGGAIAVYTRKGSDIKYEPGKGLNKSQLVGYTTAKEFYSPDYSTRTASTDVVADYRSTLYWSPYIFMDATRPSIKIEFYNNDATKKFRVVLEGVNETGKLVRIEKVFPQ
ncbi:hypothetical protein EXU57_17930 [Segetibacter sp. 3557_3]|uniref:MG2 domain-containing protein n=1 Tax=Segetibacter sp. 3557_3 TaxID=2547429 RepID=UPI001058CFBB|nr:MG2 domain-containing protein [Segetibacter sp. 3557_3]TDH23351.1 hypothetical protein EXU57_17930 [Segetibacter sp. 3557_3]